MHLVLLGLSHHNTPIELRERFGYNARSLGDALTAAKSLPGIGEAVILSTCNRMEMYLATEIPSAVHEVELFPMLTKHLAAQHNVAPTAFAPHLYRKTDQAAAVHLMRVAASLDSLVLGEAQILGQVRGALRDARTHETGGGILGKLFEQALFTGKRVQTETGLGQGGFSIGHAAVTLARQIFDDFARARVLILGAGKMSEETAQHLVRNGVRFIVVANRTHDRAIEMADRLGGSAIHYDAFPAELERADIVISATAAPHPILNRKMLQPVLRKRRGRPLFFIDIALPRDIDADVAGLDDVFLYNIDHLQHYVQQAATDRAQETARAEIIVREETDRFMAWMQARGATPVIANLRDHLQQIATHRLAILRSRLRELPDRDWQVLETQMRAMMDEVALPPTLLLKSASASATDISYDLTGAVDALFGLSAGDAAKSSGQNSDGFTSRNEGNLDALPDLNPLLSDAEYGMEGRQVETKQRSDRELKLPISAVTDAAIPETEAAK